MIGASNQRLSVYRHQLVIDTQTPILENTHTKSWIVVGCTVLLTNHVTLCALIHLSLCY